MARKDKRTLTLALVAQTRRFRSQITRARKVLNGLNSFVSRVGKTFLKFGAVISSVAITGLGVLINRTAQTIDELAKLSKGLGVAISDIQVLNRAAELNGTSAAAMQKGLQELTRRLGEAQRGTGTAIRSFNELGLSVEELTQAGPARAFEMLADKIAAIEDPAKRANAAYEIFGRSGKELMPLLLGGAAAMQEVRQEMERTGELISPEEAARVEQMNDAITRLKGVFNAFAQQITIQLAPAITGLIERAQAWMESMGGAREIISNVMNRALQMIGAVLDAMQGWRDVWNDLGAAATNTINFIGGVLEGNLQGLHENKTGVENIGAAWNNIKGSVLRVVAELINGFQQLGHIVEIVFTGAVEIVAKTMAGLVANIREHINRLFVLMNKLPGVNVGFENTRSDFLDNFSSNIEEQRKAAQGKVGTQSDLVQSLRQQSFDAFDRAAEFMDGGMQKPSERLQALWEDLQSTAESAVKPFETVPDIFEQANDVLNAGLDDALGMQKDITSEIEKQQGGTFASGKASTMAAGVGRVVGGATRTAQQSVAGVGQGIMTTAQRSMSGGETKDNGILQGILEATRKTAENTGRANMEGVLA